MTEQREIISELISKLDSESTKRLMDHCTSQFDRRIRVRTGDDGRTTEDIPFDDKLRDLVLKYARNPEDLISENRYLDSIGYGCKYVKGALQKQVEGYVVDQDTNRGSWPSFRWNKNYKKALKLVEDLLKSGGFNLKIKYPQSKEDLKILIPKENTHAGFLYVESGKKHKGDNLDGLLDLMNRYAEYGRKHGTFARPVLAGTRLQCSGAYDESGNRTGKCKHKVRFVAMVDQIQNTFEAMFSRPFQNFCNVQPWYGTGKHPDQIRDLINSNRQRHPYWMTLDYSHYDQSIPQWLLEDVFLIIWRVIATVPANRKWKWLYDIVVHDFIHKVIVGQGGRLYYTDHAILSGAMFTNMSGSIAGLIMTFTYLLAKYSDDISSFISTCGDDVLIMSSKQLDRDDISSYIRHNFGLTCNADKCHYGKIGSSDPQYLSRTWRNRGADRDIHEVWSKMLYPERYRPYFKDGVTPELMLYSYILTFPLCLERMIYLDKFYLDYPNLRSLHYSDLALVAPYITGYLSYALQYGLIAMR